MKKLGKKNVERLNTVEAYNRATQKDYDNCTYAGKESCGSYNVPLIGGFLHKASNNGTWQTTFEAILNGTYWGR